MYMQAVVFNVKSIISQLILRQRPVISVCKSSNYSSVHLVRGRLRLPLPIRGVYSRTF